MKMSFLFHANKTHNHMNRFALGFCLKRRLRTTRKWSVILSESNTCYYPYSVTNPVYQRDEQLILHDASNITRPPNAAEVIYAKPFAPIPGRSEHETGLASSAGLNQPAHGYQNLVAKSPDSGEIKYINK